MQLTDTRNDFGFPVVDKLKAAKEYAAAVRERNAPACDCKTCREIELLPAVQRILVNWGL